ncbi:hypothetical protein PENTCL1PPCAC_395, partial [Pristionchus entomophagus]
CSRIQHLVKEAYLLLKDYDVFPETYAASANNIDDAIKHAIFQCAQCDSEFPSDKLIQSCKEAEDVLVQLKSRSVDWKYYTAAKAPIKHLLNEYRTPLLNQLTMDTLRDYSEAIAVQRVFSNMIANIARLQNTLEVMRLFAQRLHPLKNIKLYVTFFENKVARVHEQATNFLNELSAECNDEEELAGSIAKVADKLTSLGSLIVPATGPEILEAILDNDIPGIEDQLELLANTSQAAEIRKFVRRDVSKIDTVMSQLMVLKHELAEVLKKAYEDEKTISAIAEQLRRLIDQTLIDDLSYDKLEALERQLLDNGSPSAYVQLYEVESLRDRKLDTYPSELRSKFTIKIIGGDSFGCVFEAEFKLIEMKYAVKRIPLKRRDAAVKKALNEVKALASFEHKGIVRYHNSWIEEPPSGWQ